MADLVYDLLSQAVKNTNITINLNAKTQTDTIQTDTIQTDTTQTDTTQTDTTQTDTTPTNAPADTEQKKEADVNNARAGGLVRADLVQLISDLESVSATFKKINKSIVGHEPTEIFFMLQNFDKILNSVKMIVHAV